MGVSLERIVKIEPAYDGRPKRRGGHRDWRLPHMELDDGTDDTNYGVGGCTLWMVLKGPRGAVQFAVITDWYPPHVQEQWRKGEARVDLGLQPIGLDVGYHSPVPLSGSETFREPGDCPGECPYVPKGTRCYYDGSSLRADDWVRDILLRKGSDGIWEALEAEYRRLFGDA